MPKKGKRRSRRSVARGSFGPGSVMAAPLATVSVPKPTINLTQVNVANGNHIFRVVGREMIAQITSTQYYQIFRTAMLNPGNPNLAPRLQAMALMFEKFRVRKFSICYHPGCPTAQGGAVGLMINMDPTDTSPGSLVQMAQYEASAVGTVGFPLEAVATFPANDPWYYVSTMVSNTTSVPQWNAPARIVVATDQSGTVYDGFFAGYISVSYDIEFNRLCPVAQTVAAGNVGTKTVTGGASLASKTMDMAWKTLIGWFEHGQSGTVLSIEDNSVESDQIARLEPSIWETAIDLVVGASSVSQRDDWFEIKKDGRENITKYRWRNPLFHPDSEVKYPDKPFVVPAAAGDITYKLSAFDVASGAVFDIESVTVSAGAGAQTFNETFGYTTTKPYLVYVTVTPTGVENRAISSGQIAHVNMNQTQASQ